MEGNTTVATYYRCSGLKNNLITDVRCVCIRSQLVDGTPDVVFAGINTLYIMYQYIVHHPCACINTLYIVQCMYTNYACTEHRHWRHAFKNIIFAMIANTVVYHCVSAPIAYLDNIYITLRKANLVIDLYIENKCVLEITHSKQWLESC